MKKPQDSMCEKLNAYFDGELNREELRKFQLHLESCVNCTNTLTQLESIRESLRSFNTVTMPDEADLRIRRFLKTDTGQLSIKDEILDIEELARFLKISVNEVVELLDRLPSFEVGGRIRFRKDRIIDWIANQEKKMVREREQHTTHSHQNIIMFPGGQS